MDSVTELTEEVAAMGQHMFRVRLPFVAELRSYTWEKFRADLIAGATVTLVSIPQAIGFSLILNLPPTPVIGGFVGSLFFSSRHHVFGPTSSISLIVAATIAANSATGLNPLQLATYLAFLIGMIQLLSGLLNFGEITKFISRSVVVAYSTGIGILLIASQLHNVLGYGVESGQNFSTNVLQALFDLGTAQVHPWAIGIAALTFLIFWSVQRIRPRWPEALIGLAILAIGAKVFTLYSHTVPFMMVRDEGALTAVLPSFAGFPFGPKRLHLLPELAGTAIAISILGMLEAASITKGLAAKSGQKIEPNQELDGRLGQGPPDQQRVGPPAHCVQLGQPGDAQERADQELRALDRPEAHATDGRHQVHDGRGAPNRRLYHLPAGVSKKNPPPLVVIPHNFSGNRWVWGFNPEVQFLASRGYAVLQPNFRGSAGYTCMYPETEDWDFGQMSDDVARATRKAIEMGLVDKNRVAIMGTSFGGYLAVAGAAFEPGLYKCAIAVSAFYDWGKYISEDKYQQYTNPTYSRYLHKLGDPASNPERYASMSPLPHASQIHSALLIAWGEYDPPELVGQSKEMASAVQRNNVPVETISFLDEADGVRHLAHRIELYEHIEAFLSKNL
jgi:pimeloyl-ACP methyl ester carboxylesterase